MDTFYLYVQSKMTRPTNRAPFHEDMEEENFQTTEEESLLLRAETSSDSDSEDENLHPSWSEGHPPFPRADTSPDPDTEEEEEPEASSTITGVVLVMISTAVFALAEHCLGLCEAAGVVTSHLLLFRSVSFFMLNLAAMMFLAVVKSYMKRAAGPQQSDVIMKSWLPLLLSAGVATTLSTVIPPMSYLFDIPFEVIQAYIIDLAPAYTTIIAYCFLGEKFATRKIWTMAVCFVGAFLNIIGVPKPENDPDDTMPTKALIALFLPVVISTAIVTSRTLLKNNVHPTTLVFSVQLTSIMYLLPFTLRYVYKTLSYKDIFNYSTQIWMAMFGHIICHCTATYLLYFGLKYEKAGIVQVLLGGTIPFSLILSYAMFGRVPFPSQMIGGALVAVSVAALVVITCWESRPCNSDIVHVE